MRDLFTSEQVQVAQALDIVQVQISTHKLRFYYQTAFDVIARGRMMATLAMPHEAMNPKFWRELAEYEAEDPGVPLNPSYRRSPFVQNVDTWDATQDGSLVVFQFNELVAKLHYSDALKLMSWINRAARKAKRWAGDDRTKMRITATLTTAEENDKRRFVA